MSKRLCLAICCYALVVNTPAAAAEVWNCTIHARSIGAGAVINAHHDQFKIDGDDLTWVQPPTTDPKTGLPIPEKTPHHRVLVNNDVGIVAVFAQALDMPRKFIITGLPRRSAAELKASLQSMIPNPLINSYTIALNKKDGSLRTGSVGTTRMDEGDTGECQPEPTPAPANPPDPK